MRAPVQRIKAAIRDGLPAQWRVPAKFWHARMTGGLEPEMALLPHLVRKGERAIDVGGNFGCYARALARLGASVELFEPNPVCLQALIPWAASRRGVRVHACALSGADGDADLAIPMGAGGIEHDAAASLERAAEGPVRIERVAMRALDGFGFDDSCFIKIDVEGHEEAVLDGAAATIAASAPALLIEIEERHSHRPVTDTIARLERLGYRGFFLLDEVLAPAARFRAAEHQSPALAGTPGYHNNFLFLAEGRIGRGDYAALVRP